MKRITITAELIKEEEGGYTVYCPELDIYTQGDDVQEATNNLKEAAELHIEELGIEQKILEVLGDPDSGLELREEFKQELKGHLENPSRRISHQEVVNRVG